ncbi:MAG: acetylserotonin O-methyltransferase [bacterium]|nr:acetylserotonin O-methyltransferase [bacterium]
MKQDTEMQKLMGIMRGFWHSRILFAGAEIGLFDALAKRPQSVREVTARLETDPRGTEILLNALTALGVLCKTGTRYSLNPGMADALVSDRPAAITSMMTHLRHMWDSWGHLDEVLRTGRPWRGPEDGMKLAEEERRTRAFIEAMHQAGQPSARELARRLDLSRVERILDIGGGPGTYCIELVRRKPDIQATILDRQLPLEVARRFIAEAGLEGSVHTRVGDALRVELEPEFDLVILSQLVHAFGPEQNQYIVNKATGGLRPGGLMVVNEFALNEDKTSPVDSALFAVNMLANTEDGRTYTHKEISGWMKKAGLRNIRSEDLLGRSTLFIGAKQSSGARRRAAPPR